MEDDEGINKILKPSKIKSCLLLLPEATTKAHFSKKQSHMDQEGR